MKQGRGNDSETLIYIEHMLRELGKLAKNTDYALLAYMIEMAGQEARDLIGAKQDH